MDAWGRLGVVTCVPRCMESRKFCWVLWDDSDLPNLELQIDLEAIE